MADEKDLLEELLDARMASKKELDNLELGKKRPLAASIKDRMGMTGDLAENMTPDKELAKRMAGASTIDDLAKPLAKTGSRMANKAETSMLSKLGSKVGKMGLGKAAAGLAGLPMLLASEAADASEVGESAVDDDIMIAEEMARRNYGRSPARADALGVDSLLSEQESDSGYFSKIRNQVLDRDSKTKERLREHGDDELRSMLDTKESALDKAEEGMSMEEKEQKAADYRLKRRRELGLE